MNQDFRTKFIDFDARRDPKTDFFCVACQKDMDRSKPSRAVHMVDGGYFALHPADEAAYQAEAKTLAGGQHPGEMGCWPIGECCAKRLGREWTHPKALWPQRSAA